MATCPECDAEIEVDEFDVDKGDQLSCPECGSNLEVTGLSPIELDLAPDDDDDDDDDDDEDDDDLEDDEDDDDEDDEEDDGGRLGGMIDKERALRETLSSLGSVVVAYSGGVDSAYLACIAHDTLGDRAGRRHRRQPELSASATARWRSQIAGRFGFRHEIIHTGELERPEYRANPANRCYYCKHELYTHLTRIAAAARRGRRRRQQRRRSRRLPAGPPGGARVRRPQPARRGRSDEGRDPRAVAPRRAADVGRAGVGVPVVAHSVSPRSHRREAADDRARRERAARRSASASAASATTTSSRASSSAATRCRARSSPKSAAAIVAS